MNSRLRKTICSIVFLICFLIILSSGFGDERFSVKRIGNLIPFNDNAFSVDAPEKGSLLISIHDEVSVYRTLEEYVAAGDTVIHWDGCGFNREKLASKDYTITAVLKGESGKVYEVSFKTPVEYTGQALQYFLTSSDCVYLDQKDEWFAELKTVQKGNVIIEFYGNETGKPLLTSTIKTTGGKLYRIPYSSIDKKAELSAGSYHIKAYESSDPAFSFEYDLDIQTNSPEPEDLFLTGEIIPDRQMSDEEIWSIMQKPSVVIDIDFFKHQKVYSGKSKESDVLGTFHGQTQAVKVIRLENDWAFVGAWNHESADYIEGWIPAKVLKVVYPRTEFGLLIDKQKQMMQVYRNGRKIDTLLVSTGRPEVRHQEQETAAGAFLTGYHRVDFSMNGRKYDYVIQYDGGNLLHQIPYEWGKNKKDFSFGRGYLGAKASHACIRIQAEPGNESGINAYWIWTHIPYHTRVIIMDDPVERLQMDERIEASTDPIRTALSYQPQIISVLPETDGSCVTLDFDKESFFAKIPEGNIWQTTLDGHVFGFVLCSEKEFLKNPEIVDAGIEELSAGGSERIILVCHWDQENTKQHTPVQESMTRRGARAGADLVIGYGYDSIQGAEYFENTPILFNLGSYNTGKRTNRKSVPSLSAKAVFRFDAEKRSPDLYLFTSQPEEAEAGTHKNVNIDEIIYDFSLDSTGAAAEKMFFCTENQS